MRVVQALHWLKDTLPADKPRIVKGLKQLLATRQEKRDRVMKEITAKKWRVRVIEDADHPEFPKDSSPDSPTRAARRLLFCRPNNRQGVIA